MKGRRKKSDSEGKMRGREVHRESERERERRERIAIHSLTD